MTDEIRGVIKQDGSPAEADLYLVDLSTLPTVTSDDTTGAYVFTDPGNNSVIPDSETIYILAKLGATLRVMTHGPVVPVESLVELWTPAELMTALWLDAADADTITKSGTAVSLWADKSGNGAHVSQETASKQPTYNATTVAIEFDGVGDGLWNTTTRLGLSANPDIMVLAVATPSAVVAASQSLIQIGGTDASNSMNLAASADSSGWAWRYNGGNEIYSAVSVGVTKLAAWVRASGSNFAAAQFFLGGVEQSATSSSGGTLVPTDTTTTIYVGSGVPSGLYSYPGGIHELIVVNSSDTTTRQLLEGYLAFKWGLTANLPADHPYKSVPPYVS